MHVVFLSYIFRSRAPLRTRSHTRETYIYICDAYLDASSYPLYRIRTILVRRAYMRAGVRIDRKHATYT